MSLDLSAMTLADAEALAVRLETAARTIRDALAMMGGASPKWGPGVVAEILPIQQALARDAGGVLLTNKGPVRLTDEEQAQKDALRRQREADELEADMKRVKGA